MGSSYNDAQRTERKLNRIKDLYWFIQEQGEVKTHQLVEEFQMSLRTIQRDLDTLVYNGLILMPARGVWKPTDKKVKR